MILSEGRKEDAFKKYERSIEAERKMISNYMDNASAYDFLLSDPFMIQTNFKYLNDILEHYYTVNYYSGEAEPSKRNDARNILFGIRSQIEKLIAYLEIFEKHKSKFKYSEFRKYLPNLQDFSKEVERVKKEIEKKQLEIASKKEIDKIFENDIMLIIKPKSHTASCYYGSGTKWCTTMAGNPSYFNQYTSNGTLYYLILKNVDRDNKFYKMAINTKKFENFGVNSMWYDSHDNILSDREKEAVLAHLPKDAYNLMSKDHLESFKTISVITLIEDALLKSDIGSDTYVEKFGDKKIKFDFYNIELSELHNIRNNEEILAKIQFTIVTETNNKGTVYYEDCKVVFSIKPNKTIPPTSEYQYVDIRGQVITEMESYSDIILKDYKFLIPSFEVSVDNGFVGMEKSIKKMTKKIHENIITNTNTQILNDEKLRKWFGYGPKKYTMAGYTFTKGGKVTKAFMDYLNSKKEGEVGSRIEFLNSIGKPTSPGYLSSFFSGLNQAGISKRVGKSGITKGPNFDKVYKNYFQS